MAHSLKRLLRLRLLVEETSRVELERRVALAVRIEGERQSELRTARQGRTLAAASICDEIGAGEQAIRRSAGWQTVEGALRREAQLGELAQAVESSVMESRAEFLERRKERRQVESILDAAEEQARGERERKLQRELDDWFGMKQIRLAQNGRRAAKS